MTTPSPERAQRPAPAILRLTYELIITGMETVGLLFLAIGAGLFASWVAGVAGFFLVCGAVLLIAAWICARRQQGLTPKPRVAPAPAPMTRSAPPRTDPLATTAASVREPVLTRLRNVFSP